jgi:hypothetical protein
MTDSWQDDNIPGDLSISFFSSFPYFKDREDHLSLSVSPPCIYSAQFSAALVLSDDLPLV